MTNLRTALCQHLELAAAAFGADLLLPPGRAAAQSGPREQTVEVGSPSVANPPTDRPRADLATEQPSADLAEAGGEPASQPPAGPAKAAPVSATPPPGGLPTPNRSPAAAPTAFRQAEPAPEERATDAAAALAALRTEALACTRCKLAQGRNHVVFGEGPPTPRVVFLGEAPGAQEDRTGRPFVGQAGQLLDKILANAMGLRRDEVYIANVNKCRPPENRTPEAEEVAACLPFLRRQIEILRPEVIVCLGRTAAQNLLSTTESTSALRGRTLDYHGVPVVVTWHPAYLLREPTRKRETWDDIKRVNRLLGRPEVPPPIG